MEYNERYRRRQERHKASFAPEGEQLAALPAAAHAGALPVFQAGELAACPLCSASNKAPSRCHGMMCTNTDCKHVIRATAAVAAPKASGAEQEQEQEGVAAAPTMSGDKVAVTAGGDAAPSWSGPGLQDAQGAEEEPPSARCTARTNPSLPSHHASCRAGGRRSGATYPSDQAVFGSDGFFSAGQKYHIVHKPDTPEQYASLCFPFPFHESLHLLLECWTPPKDFLSNSIWTQTAGAQLICAQLNTPRMSLQLGFWLVLE